MASIWMACLPLNVSIRQFGSLIDIVVVVYCVHCVIHMMVRFHFTPYDLPYHQSSWAFEATLAGWWQCMRVCVCVILYINNRKLLNAAEVFLSDISVVSHRMRIWLVEMQICSTAQHARTSTQWIEHFRKVERRAKKKFAKMMGTETFLSIQRSNWSNKCNKIIKKKNFNWKVLCRSEIFTRNKVFEKIREESLVEKLFSILTQTGPTEKLNVSISFVYISV